MEGAKNTTRELSVTNCHRQYPYKKHNLARYCRFQAMEQYLVIEIVALGDAANDVDWRPTASVLTESAVHVAWWTPAQAAISIQHVPNF